MGFAIIKSIDAEDSEYYWGYFDCDLIEHLGFNIFQQLYERFEESLFASNDPSNNFIYRVEAFLESGRWFNSNSRSQVSTINKIIADW